MAQPVRSRARAASAVAPWLATPAGFLRAAVSEVPSLRYAMGAGGLAAVVAIVVVGWKLPPAVAALGGLVVLIAMVALVIFAALARSRPRVMQPLALFLGWAFLLIAVTVAALFVSCAFFSVPKTLSCLLQGTGCTGPDPAGDYEGLVEQAQAILADVYAEEFDRVFVRFPETFRRSTTFAQFQNTLRRQLRQLEGGPIHRELVTVEEQAGYLVVGFDAEYDETTVWREWVTFAKTPAGWRLNTFVVKPRSWIATGSNTRLLSESEPLQVIQRVAARPEASDEVVGSWVPAAGWRVRSAGPGTRKAKRTCDLRASAGGASLIARNVLGACTLPPGTDLLVVGKVTAADGQHVELDEVMFQIAGDLS